MPASLETVHNIFGSLVARYREEEVLTAIRQIPARGAKFRPVPSWLTSALLQAYRAKGIRELYSHQTSIAEFVRNRKNVVVVTPTASGKTLCYNLPVLNAVLENSDTRALYLFPTKALAQWFAIHDRIWWLLADKLGNTEYRGANRCCRIYRRVPRPGRQSKCFQRSDYGCKRISLTVPGRVRTAK